MWPARKTPDKKVACHDACSHGNTAAPDHEQLLQ